MSGPEWLNELRDTDPSAAADFFEQMHRRRSETPASVPAAKGSAADDAGAPGVQKLADRLEAFHRDGLPTLPPTATDSSGSAPSGVNYDMARRWAAMTRGRAEKNAPDDRISFSAMQQELRLSSDREGRAAGRVEIVNRLPEAAVLDLRSGVFREVATGRTVPTRVEVGPSRLDLAAGQIAAIRIAVTVDEPVEGQLEGIVDVVSGQGVTAKIWVVLEPDARGV